MPCPDVVVVDPARPGLSPAVVAYLRTCGARRLVYVSCNASTQARDIALLCAQPVEGDESKLSAGSGGDGGTQAGGPGSSSSDGSTTRSSSGGGGDGTGGGISGSSCTSSGGSCTSSGPYRLVSVQACDLYPQTWHVETVAVLDILPAPGPVSIGSC